MENSKSKIFNVQISTPGRKPVLDESQLWVGVCVPPWSCCLWWRHSAVFALGSNINVNEWCPTCSTYSWLYISVHSLPPHMSCKVLTVRIQVLMSDVLHMDWHWTHGVYCTLSWQRIILQMKGGEWEEWLDCVCWVFPCFHLKNTK